MAHYALIAAAIAVIAAPLEAAVLGGGTPTRVVILGVDHSTQLVAERQQPAVLRAFFARVAPAAIAVERSPEEFARGDHYEFTYEIQHVALPFAQERGIPVYPIDWIPSRDDMLLGFGVDLEAPPFVRGGWRGFLSFPDSADLHAPLLFADDERDRGARREPWLSEWEPASRDLPRRLFLYRTFLQAQRIARVAELYPGRTLLVQIGANHKDDIERILAGHPRIQIVQPSTFGEPAASEVEGMLRRDDLVAIARFNLLGVQASTGNVNWSWMRRVVERLGRDGGTPETRLFETRLDVLTGALVPHDAITRYERIRADAGDTLTFTWTGVKDRARLDSYFDPFGNLGVRHRAAVELARELYKLGHPARARVIQDELLGVLSPTQALQLRAYWAEHVVEAAEGNGPCECAAHISRPGISRDKPEAGAVR